MNRTLNFTAGLILVWIIGYLLIVGRSLLIPLVIAIFLWNLLNTIKRGVKQIPYVGVKLPDWLSMLLALVVVAIFFQILIHIISNNVNEVISASPRYQENLTKIFNNADQRFHIKSMLSIDSFVKQISVKNILINIYSVFTTIRSGRQPRPSRTCSGTRWPCALSE